MPGLESAIEEAIKVTPESLAAVEEKTETVIDPALQRKEGDAPPEEVEAPPVEDLSELETANAKQLWKALKDPNTAPSVIKFIAEQNGYVPPTKAPETPKEVAKEENKVAKILSKHLGPELQWLVDKLSPAIEEASAELMSENVKDLREAHVQSELDKFQSQGDRALVVIAEKVYGKADVNAIPEKVYTRMSQLMDEMPPSGQMTMETYLTRLHSIAAFENNVSAKTVTATAAKQRTQTPALLNKEKTSTAEKVATDEKKGLDAAVKAAVEAVNADLEK